VKEEIPRPIRPKSRAPARVAKGEMSQIEAPHTKLKKQGYFETFGGEKRDDERI